MSAPPARFDLKCALHLLSEFDPHHVTVCVIFVSAAQVKGPAVRLLIPCALPTLFRVQLKRYRWVQGPGGAYVIIKNERDVRLDIASNSIDFAAVFGVVSLQGRNMPYDLMSVDCHVGEGPNQGASVGI